MNPLDLAQMNFFQRIGYRTWHGILSIPHVGWGLLVRFGKGFAGFFLRIWTTLTQLCDALIHGDWKTRLSFVVMGFGCLFRGQIIKGLLYLAAEVLFILYLVLFAAQYLAKLGTLGTESIKEIWNEKEQIYEYIPGDNSMYILLFSVLSILIILAFVLVYASSVLSSHRAQKLIAAGKKPATFKQDLKALMNERYHVTLLTLPTIMVLAFIIIPLIFMILIAFTNFDKNHQPPGNLFTWLGTQNFKDVFWQDPLKSFTFGRLLLWTLVWAVLATFSNYIFGIILALLINKKGIRGKKVWRTIFITTIAVPQFVSLLLMSQLLQEQGALNVLLEELGWITQPIPFLSDATLARTVVILVNMWIGIPYTLLIVTGILMNIPEDLYESARIDGAGPIRTFFSITLPYMLFVTSPYLITQFVGNINNFNVIFLLTGGGPLTQDYYQAGKTDLLVTWLYKQTVNQQDYSLAATIGILVFLISAIFSLIVYNSTSSAKREEEFS